MRNRTALIAAAVIAAGSLTAEAAPSTGRARTADGEIGYQVLGHGGSALPVIVVNGGPGLSHAYLMMNDLWPKVAKGRMVVVYDQRGTGVSKAFRAGSPQTMEAQVADLEAVRSALGLQRFALVGDSFGGMIAMAYAAAHPEHVTKLVLSDSAAPSWKSMVHLLPQTFPDIEASDEAEQARLGAGSEAAARASLRAHFSMIFYSPAKRDAYMERMGDLGFEPEVSQAVSKATADLDLTPKLAAFTFPTLVVTGRYDMNVAPLTAWRIAHEIPHAKLVVFEKSGHLPAYEEPERYRAVLTAFLGEP
ncbi:MAG TPA: alpha/beta hydrolase [Caulobacteraceae bacterium]|jgi:proline iminopeptidase